MRKIVCLIIGLIVLFAEDSTATKTSIESQSKTKTASDSMNLRKIRRAGIGIVAAGSLGLLGFSSELNFSPAVGFVMGYGGGPGYQAYKLEIKNYMGEKSIHSYIGGGYAHWYSVGAANSSMTSSTPSFLANSFLSNEEKRFGRFARDFIYPMLGLQFLQLSGPWAGSSLFAEIEVIVDLKKLVGVPTGALGYLYYF